MDIGRFQTVRPVQRRSVLRIEGPLDGLDLETCIALGEPFHSHSLFIDTLARITGDTSNPYAAYNQAGNIAEDFFLQKDFIDPLTLYGPAPRQEIASFVYALLILLVALDLKIGKGATASALATDIDAFIAQWGSRQTAREREQLDLLCGRFLMACLCAAIVLPQASDRLVIRPGIAERYQRLLALFHLYRSLVPPRSKPVPEGPLQAWLRRFRAELPARVFPKILPPPLSMVRRVAVGDLWVIRKEWRAYVAGEVADIRNVMAKEAYSLETARIDEIESTITREELASQLSERENSTGTENELSEEVASEMRLQMAAEAEVKAGYEAGPVKIDARVAGSVDYAIEESSRSASRFAQNVVSRALTRFDERTRKERIDRTLSRTERRSKHGFENSGATALSGVYRWVDRVDRLQLFRYADRLLLEFQLPEPGRRLRDLLTDAAVPPLAVDAPPAFDVEAALINRSTYTTLATKYRATGVPPPPDNVVGTSKSLTYSLASLPTGDGTTEIWNSPTLAGTDSIRIPPGYQAVRATYRIHATPLRAKWRVEGRNTTVVHTGTPPPEPKRSMEGFHRVVVNVAVGGLLRVHSNAGEDSASLFSVQRVPDVPDRMLVQYGQATLLAQEQLVSIIPAALGPELPVVLSGVGVSSLSATVQLECAPTEKTMATWRQEVFDALLAAWQTWKREYEAERSAAGAPSAPIRERASDRNAEMVRTELKRLVLAALMEESPLRGRDALHPDNPHFPSLHYAALSADEIQFLEQAFEWSNLSYVPYPYYWADPNEWDTLAKLETVDRDLQRFLASGSCRVVVPARPSMASAVQHWLTFRRPWSGGAAPTPVSDEYLSVAEEIRSLDAPPPDGEPGECWEIRTSTPLQWIDPSPTLPRNAHSRLGLAPFMPTNPIVID